MNADQIERILQGYEKYTKKLEGIIDSQDSEIEALQDTVEKLRDQIEELRVKLVEKQFEDFRPISPSDVPQQPQYPWQQPQQPKYWMSDSTTTIEDQIIGSISIDDDNTETEKFGNSSDNVQRPISECYDPATWQKKSSESGARLRTTKAMRKSSPLEAIKPLRDEIERLTQDYHNEHDS